MISKDKFKIYVSELTQGEEESLKKTSKSSKDSSMLVLGIIFFAIGFVTFSSGIGIVFCFIGVFMFGIGGILSSKKANERKAYKNKYIDKILGCLLEGYDYTFDSEGQIEERIFQSSQFGSFYDKYKGEDKLSINIPNDDGSKSNVYLTLCDLDVVRIEIVEKKDMFEDDDSPFNHSFGREKEEREITVFSGVFGYVDFPFEFKCVLGLNTKYRKKGVNLEVVKLEDILFHKKFGVYCNDQIEARYILTPDMMEKLLDLYNVYKGIRMVLVDNRMYFSLPSKNILELKNYKGDSASVFDGIYDDISNILSIVNEIKKNNKIFKM